MLLDGQVAIVTGASVGLGRSMAMAMARSGARVTLASPQKKLLEETADEINARYGAKRAIAVVTDITKPADCARVVQETLKAFGDLSVLVNNARREQRGPGLPVEGNNFPFWESNPEIWVEAVNVNVSGTFLMSRAVAPHLIKRKWGRIINISTSLDTMQRKHNSPYGVTKAAVDAASLIWAADLQGTGVTCNILIPGGMVDTDGTRPATPERRTLPVDVMDDAVIWFASPQSNGHNGERFVGSRWRKDVPPHQAAVEAREAPVLRKPEPRR
jgi:3-oxoacyl-[acyl-carrier protein] reductase